MISLIFIFIRFLIGLFLILILILIFFNIVGKKKKEQQQNKNFASAKEAFREARVFAEKLNVKNSNNEEMGWRRIGLYCVILIVIENGSLKV